MDIDIILVSFASVRLFDRMDVRAVAAYASLYDTVIIEEMDRSDYRNSVRSLLYTFVKVTENKRISLVDTNLNIVC